MISVFLRGNFASNQFEKRDAILKDNNKPFNNKSTICDVYWFRKHPADIRAQLQKAPWAHDRLMLLMVMEVKARRWELKFKMINRKGCAPKETLGHKYDRETFLVSRPVGLYVGESQENISIDWVI